MKTLWRFLSMYITAGLLMFLGLDLADIPAKQMIMITGSICGVVNMLYYWIEKD